MLHIVAHIRSCNVTWMPDREQRPILVTGSHRSGTGWVGGMIAASRAQPVAYLWEPFSPLARPGIRDVPFHLWFTFVCPGNETTYEPGLRHMLAYDYRWGAELRAMRRPKDVARAVRDADRFRRFRRNDARPLLKDPIALFSAEWVADRLSADVVVLIRHPAAFVQSIVGRKLRHPFGDFVDQPLLMEDLLAPYADEIRTFAREERPLFDQGILLWNVLHHAIERFRERRPDWLFMRLEDLARDPLERFTQIFEHVNVPVEVATRERIATHSSTDNPEQVADMASTKRNSAEAVVAWKRKLSSEQIASIRERVEPLAGAFYGPEDW
jgi:hypothetical protein